jgi:hypothetical protein
LTFAVFDAHLTENQVQLTSFTIVSGFNPTGYEIRTMTESISGRLRTLLGNKSADADQPDDKRDPGEPAPTAAHVPPFVTSPTLPPDAAVLHDAQPGEALFTDVPPPTPALPTDLPAARTYQAELQRKMTALAEDFSLGKINRRQFEAVYTHYASTPDHRRPD